MDNKAEGKYEWSSGSHNFIYETITFSSTTSDDGEIHLCMKQNPF
jgi:hypothetical protein